MVCLDNLIKFIISTVARLKDKQKCMCMISDFANRIQISQDSFAFEGKNIIDESSLIGGNFLVKLNKNSAKILAGILMGKNNVQR